MKSINRNKPPPPNIATDASMTLPRKALIICNIIYFKAITYYLFLCLKTQLLNHFLAPLIYSVGEVTMHHSAFEISLKSALWLILLSAKNQLNHFCNQFTLPPQRTCLLISSIQTRNNPYISITYLNIYLDISSTKEYWWEL